MTASTIDQRRFYRIRDIVRPNGILPICRSRWYAGIANQEFPRPKKIGSISCWDREAIEEVARRIEAGEFAEKRAA